MASNKYKAHNDVYFAANRSNIRLHIPCTGITLFSLNIIPEYFVMKIDKSHIYMYLR